MNENFNRKYTYRTVLILGATSVANEKSEKQLESTTRVAKARAKITSNAGDFTIEEANKHLDTEELLEKYSYIQRGDRWISPNTKQEVSPSAGVVVFDDDHWFSHHSSDIEAGVGYAVDGGGCLWWCF